jgi:hypothetical protein
VRGAGNVPILVAVFVALSGTTMRTTTGTKIEWRNPMLFVFPPCLSTVVSPAARCRATPLLLSASATPFRVGAGNPLPAPRVPVAGTRRATLQNTTRQDQVGRRFRTTASVNVHRSAVKPTAPSVRSLHCGRPLPRFA